MAKIILGLVGPIASGKDASKKYLEKKYGASGCRFSSILRDILERIDLPNSRENMQGLSTILRQKFGEDILAKAIAADAVKFKSNIVVVDGVRRSADIKFLNKIQGFALVAIDAIPKIRYERLVKRAENAGDAKKTYKQFLKDHQYETELAVPTLMKKAKFKLDNNGSFADLYKQIDKLIKNL
ncbi:MAG: dephospho-CoA kinase, CoaE [Parcubacteria group bacterium Gr01-1014_73]|nr:MAG: dephospho-CoA kinase, CoaE [Parcubacteria group bacterium Gr01-1014_73]